MPSRNAKREAFSRCPETCKPVHNAINVAILKELRSTDVIIEGTDLEYFCFGLAEAAFEAAKQYGTEVLRQALIEAEEERLAAEDKLSDAEDKIANLTALVERLEVDVRDANDERRQAQQEAQRLQDTIDGALV